MTDAEEVVIERPPMGYTVEGGGVVAGCKGCGWEIWKPNRHDAEAAAAGHAKCRADLVSLHQRLTARRRPRYASRSR